MDRRNRLEAIQEGKFLSLQSNFSVDSTTIQVDDDRPYIIPEYDPEGSIYTSRHSKYLATKPSMSQLTCSSFEIINGHAGHYDKEESSSAPAQIKQHEVLHSPAPRYGPNNAGPPAIPIHPPPYRPSRPRLPPRPATLRQRTAERMSRLSITPSIAGAPCILPNRPATQHFDTIVSQQPGKISPMHIVKLPDRTNPDAPPDGGTLAWMQVLAGFFVIMDAQGLNQSYGVFQAYYETTLLRASSPSAIAWIGSLQIFLLFFMSIVVSTQMDKGRFRHCFTGGSVLLVASVLATSWCTRYWHFVLAQGVGTGAGMGLVFGAGAQVLFTYFDRRLGVATGVASAGGAVGGMVFPAICETLVGRIGFGWTVRVIALIVLVTLLPCNLIVRERPGRRQAKKPQMDWSAFTDVPYLLVMAGLFCIFWGVYFGFYFIVAYAQQTLHLSAAGATNLLILMNASNLPGRLLPPLISDSCLGPLNTLIPCTFLTASLLFLWLGASTPTAIHLLACFYGFAAAGVQSLYNAAIWGVVKVPLVTPTIPSPPYHPTGSSFSSSSSTAHSEDYDGCDVEKVREGVGGAVALDEGKARLRLAMVFVMIGVACLTGAPLGGVLLDRGKGSWTGAQMFAGTSVAVGGVLLVGARWAREGWESGRV